MNRTKRITVILMMVLLAAAVFSVLTFDTKQEETEFETDIRMAEQNMKRMLYQKAISDYQAAAMIQNSQELQRNLMNAYEQRYQESKDILDEYLSASELAVSAYPEDTKLLLTYAANLVRSDKYGTAYRKLKEAKEKGLDTQDVNRLFEKIKYTVVDVSVGCQSFKGECNGFYPVLKSEGWEYLATDGTTGEGSDYQFASQISEDNMRLVTGKIGTVIENGDGIIQGRFSFVPADSGIIREDCIAINNSASWSYYNTLGDLLFGGFMEASDFQDGMAAVKDKDGNWFFIDTEGDKADGQIYGEIRINPDHTWKKGGRVFLKSGGVYRICNEQLEPVSDFVCDEIGSAGSDGVYAFRKDGLWGFVDQDGTVVISPVYEAAKSYANGMAAVCRDGLWGFIDSSGSQAVECMYADADYFNESMHCLVMDENAGEWKMITFKVSFEE